MSSVGGERLGRSARHHDARTQGSAESDPRPRTVGASLAGFPIANVVVLEVGAAAAMILLVVRTGLWPLSVVVLVAAGLIGSTRWHGRWLPMWIVVIVRYLLRTRTRHTGSVPLLDDQAELNRGNGPSVTGPEDVRVAVLRLLVDDLVVASSTDHEQSPIGLAWHKGTWTAALLVDPQPAMVSPVRSHADVPLAALADCLQDRGVVLDAIGVIWHCYPGNSRLPAGSPAVEAYNEVLGPLPAVAQRSTWVTLRLDPRRCPSAVRERGGGVAGAHRALLGATSRVRGALDLAGLNSHVLSSDELLRAAVSSAELSAAASGGQQVELREHWKGVSSGGIAHSSYGISGWPDDAGQLDSLTSIRALSTTVALALTPDAEDGKVGMRGVVRVSARTRNELDAANDRVRELTASSAVRLSPLNGQQAAAILATLPVGGAA